MPGQYDPERALSQSLRPQAAAKPSLGLGVVMAKPDFQVTWLVPFLTFTGVILLFSLAFPHIPTICVLVSVMLFFLGCVLLSLGGRGPVWAPLGTTLLTAVVTATALGLFLEDTYAVFPLFYANARTYTDVVPSQPARSVSDAGRIVFSADSRVDARRAVGYVTEDGYTYCAAPINDNSNTSRVEFWAVGLGCCSERGTFECDQVADASAHAGVRVFDNGGWFANSNLDNYERARLKAEATFGLLSSGSAALYVRWVREDNLELLARHYRGRLIVALLLLIFVYLLASAALAFTLYKPRGPPP